MSDKVAAAPSAVFTQDAGNKLAVSMAKNSAIVFIGGILGRVLQFLLQIVLGRLLGPGGFGNYVLGLSFVDIGKTVAGLGLDRAGVRYAAIFLGENQPERAARLVRLSLGLSVLTGAFFGATLYFLAPLATSYFQNPESARVIQLFAIGLPFAVVAFVASGLVRGANKMALDMAVTDIGQPLLNLAVLVGLALMSSRDLRATIIALNISLVAAAAISVGALIKVFPTALRRVQLPRLDIQPILSYSAYMMLISICTVAMFRVDKLVLGGLVAATQVGIYGASSMISQQNALVILAINKAFSPRVATLYHQGEHHQLDYLFKMLNRWSTATTFPLMLVSILLSREILGVMGPKFVDGWLVLAVMSFGQFTNASTGSAGVFLNMSGHQRLDLINLVITIILDVVLILVLTPQLGVLGAAIAFAVATAVINLARLIEVYRLTGIQPYDPKLVPVFLSGGATLAIWLLIDQIVPWQGFVKLIVGALTLTGIYAIILLKWGLQAEDRKIIRSFMARLQPASAKFLARWSR